jgi:hypothetical protein
MPVATKAPTAMVVLTMDDGSQEAAAFDERGEIITATVDPDGNVAWDDGTIADARGGGGQEGFEALHDALTAAEANAASIGLDVHRVTEAGA